MHILYEFSASLVKQHQWKRAAKQMFIHTPTLGDPKTHKKRLAATVGKKGVSGPEHKYRKKVLQRPELHQRSLWCALGCKKPWPQRAHGNVSPQ